MNLIRTVISNRRDARIQAIAGYTMIELLVVCVIVGILLAVGVPSFRYVTVGNRVSSEINGLLGDLQFARAEAIKEGTTISICAAANSTTCVTSGTAWASGWLVFTDLNADGIVNGNDQILRVQNAFTNTDTLTSDNALYYLTFSREGFLMNLLNGVTFTLHDATANTQWSRCLSGSIVGALSTQRHGDFTMENAACN